MYSKKLSLNTLKPNPGSRKPRTRVGRGEGSGHGKTSGRGGKGQTARSGGTIRAGFEGGQTPLYRRIPKVGFRARVSVEGLNDFSVVRLSVLERLENGTTVDIAKIRELGYAKKSAKKAGVKILGDNTQLTKKLHLKVNAISAAAKASVEAAGGSVELLTSKA